VAPRASLANDIGTLVAKSVDTAEDALLHLRRLGAEKLLVETPTGYDDARDTRPRIVVLGAGWGAHAFIKVIDATAFRVTVVSPRGFFLFTPMLAATAVGTVEYRSIIESVRASNPLVEYVEGAAVDCDPSGRTISVRLNSLLAPIGETRGDADDDSTGGGGADAGCAVPLQGETLTLSYDRLIVACGSRVSLADVPGAQQYCHRLKELTDARELRRAIGEAFERAARRSTSAEEIRRLLTFVVVGGGPTGVELSGELTDLIAAEALRLYPALAGKARVLLVHGGDELLAPFEPSLREAAAEGLRRRGVELVLRSRVERVDATEIALRTKAPVGAASAEVARSQLPYGVCVWCAGTVPQPIVSALLDKLPPAARAKDGRIAVDPWLRVRSADGNQAVELGSIIAIGDAACETFDADDSPRTRETLLRSFMQGLGGAPDAAAPPTAAAAAATEARPLPQTAQVAGQQGAYVARALVNRGYNLGLTPPRLDESASSTAGGARWWLVLRGVGNAPQFSFLNLGARAAASPRPRARRRRAGRPLRPSARVGPRWASPRSGARAPHPARPRPAPLLRAASRRARRPRHPRVHWRRRGALAGAARGYDAAQGGGLGRLPALALGLPGQAGRGAQPHPRQLRLAQDVGLRARHHALLTSGRTCLSVLP
jgi:NADH dehydrogenase FAD-containing subunit